MNAQDTIGKALFALESIGHVQMRPDLVILAESAQDALDELIRDMGTVDEEDDGNDPRNYASSDSLCVCGKLARECEYLGKDHPSVSDILGQIPPPDPIVKGYSGPANVCDHPPTSHNFYGCMVAGCPCRYSMETEDEKESDGDDTDFDGMGDSEWGLASLQDHQDVDPHYCPVCDSADCTVQGVLGRRVHLRCNACGWEFSFMTES